MSFADLHIHIGRSLNGKPVKITAANDLTLPNLINTARDIKGLSLAGVVDAHSTGVQQDFAAMLQEGRLIPLSGGGYRAGSLVVIPGTEVELDVAAGSAHLLAYFPSMHMISLYVEKMRPYVKNWQLSSQKAFLSIDQWLEIVHEAEGVWMPAHAFTPHKGIYGNCCSTMSSVLPEMPKALEIGLSADRSMALSLSELDSVILFSNSDAHSLPKIGREYNLVELEEESFTGLAALLAGKAGRLVTNYGLPPEVGKYYRTFCLVCEQVVTEAPPQLSCPYCGSRQVVLGVEDRLASIADRSKMFGSSDSAGYIYQVPLQQLPGVGPKAYAKLLTEFGTEMNVLHMVPEEELRRAVGNKLARWIVGARDGELVFASGGGGYFGRVVDILPGSQE